MILTPYLVLILIVASISIIPFYYVTIYIQNIIGKILQASFFNFSTSFADKLNINYVDIKWESFILLLLWIIIIEFFYLFVVYIITKIKAYRIRN